MLIDEFLPKVEEWIDRSNGKLRADVAYDKLLALGFAGSERTTRRAVAAVKKNYRLGRVRVHRPWVTEPGMWLLCRILHRSHYDATATMRRELAFAVAVSPSSLGQGLREAVWSQSFQEGQEGVGGVVAPWAGVWWCGPGEGTFLHGEVGVKVDLCGADICVA